MKRQLLTRLGILSLLAACLLPRSAANLEKTPADLAPAAMHHIEKLAGLGGREAGSKNEAKALAYIDKELNGMGLKTRREYFRFSAYALQTMRLSISGRGVIPEFAAFDVYDVPSGVSGMAVFIDPQAPREELFKLDLTDKIAVSASPANRFDLAFRKPKAVIFLKPDDFQTLKETSGQTAELQVRGQVKKKNSANLVAVLPATSLAAKRIVVSAHYDATRGPGASDNASGVAIMIEIARYFREKRLAPACQLEFVALGAEEVGMVGSRIFVAEHGRDLADCELLFNIDTVGGGGAIYIEMRGGVQGISAHKGESQIPPGLAGKAETDSGGRWGWLQPQLLAPLMASCVPDWLKQEIKAAAAELGYAFTPSNYMGSDHLVFAQAGIPATNIAVSGSEVHGPADTPDKISLQSLEKAAAIVIRVVEKTMARIASGN